MSTPRDWGLVVPFWIDTDGYSDRDRDCFVAGFEFCQIVRNIETGNAVRQLIHRENESRVRMLCGRNGRHCTITQHVGYVGCETWSDLVVEANS